MRCLKRQEGVALIMLLGLMAALSVGAAGAALLLTNSIHFTQGSTQSQKAFNVAEGAFNVGMATLQASWPTTSNSTVLFPTSTFRGQYSTTTYPNPSSGNFITVNFFDDSSNNGVNGTVSPSTSPGWDKGSPSQLTTPDNEMYIRATARVGSAAATVQGLVQRTFWNPALPMGIAAYSGGTISSNSQGGGTMPKVRNDVAPPTINNGLATVYAADGYSPSAIMQSGTLQVNTGSSVPPIDSIVTPQIIAGIKAVAQANGRYFSGTNAISNALNSTASPMGGPGLQGLTVIDPPSGDTTDSLQLPSNTESTPALLLVLGDSTTSVGFNNAGNSNMYGFFYTRYGNFDFARGTVSAYGTVICAGDIGFKGTPQTIYDNNVLTNLSSQWTLNVKLVPNTWRELQPGATN